MYGDHPKREYSRPCVWQFHLQDFVPYTTKGVEQTRQSNDTVGVLACSFDDAYKVLREKKPDSRISGVTRHDVPVSFVVDDPRVVEVGRRLGQQE